MRLRLLLCIGSTCFIALVNSIKYVPSFVFPPLSLNAGSEVAEALRAKLSDIVRNVLEDHSVQGQWDAATSSFAIQLTSTDETIWASYHTAAVTGDIGAAQKQVTGQTAFRVASLSKTFTVLALLLEKSIHLDDPVTDYIPELSHTSENLIQWHQISLRALASHLAGIPRDTGGNCFVWNEILDREDILPMLAELGFPPPNTSERREQNVCRIEDIIENARQVTPVYNPNDRSTYSNIAFSLLGAVLQRATGEEYEDIIRATVLDPLDMHQTTSLKPLDSQGIIPVDKNDWRTDLGADAPTAGLYSTADDLSKYLRSILGAELLSQAEVHQWLKPVSWSSSGSQSAYGMPWEIQRMALNPGGRVVDIFAKGGSLKGYYSSIMLFPEFGLGLTILVAGAETCLDELRERLATALVPAIDAATRDHVRSQYVGKYLGKGEGWRIELEIDEGSGLRIVEWTSNGTNFLQSYRFLQSIPESSQAILVPTGVLLREKESWRITWDRSNNRMWSDFRFTNVDDIVYDNTALSEMLISTKRNTIEALGITYTKAYEG
ncbi:hypothetical protein BP5796_11881 [Coleophoma crateriformis]|uniref:Uncharacterized protein n=1 Tax=Coleophoma crateriformis TaxID=565419 RepID=A0A3D8QEM3_9HELO|nr:hypothetical protein BP5796_11881 [Coleophoma crateriformis]